MGGICAKIGGLTEIQDDIEKLKKNVELLEKLTAGLEKGSKMIQGQMKNLEEGKSFWKRRSQKLLILSKMLPKWLKNSKINLQILMKQRT